MLKKKNNKKKILIIIGVVLVIGVGVFIILNRNNIFKNNKLAMNEKLIIKEIEVESNLNEISVISSRIESLGKVSSIFVKIKNNTGSDIDKSVLKLIVLDNNNNILLTSFIKEFNDFKINEEREFQVSTNNDLSKAFKYIVEKVEE